MWSFLESALKQYGLAAVIILAVLGAGGIAIRELWRRNQALAKEIREKDSQHYQAVLGIRVEHARELAELRDAFMRDNAALGARLDALHERRVEEAQAIVREVVEHVGETHRAVERINTMMSDIRDLIRTGGGRYAR